MSPEEYKTLKALCLAGKLFEIQQWIAEGKPIDPPPEGKESLLWVAMETGFVSKVELLLKASAGPYYHGNALCEAAQTWKTDICELLIRHKVKLKGVDFPWICSHAPFAVIKMLIDYGADLFKGNPIAWALTRNIRPILGIYRRLAEKDPRFQKQADMALRHLVEKKNARGVMLMLWAGANPHARVPALEFHGTGGDLKSAVYEACYEGDLDLVKRFKPDPEKDDFGELVYIGMFSRNVELLRYLLTEPAPFPRRVI